MEIKVRSEKGQITDAMKDYATSKLEKLTKYISDNDNVTGNVLFKVNGVKQKVEITIPLKSVTLRIEESGEDFYSIIDIAIDKLERQIKKNKTKIEARNKAIPKDFILDFDYLDDEENNKIVKRKTIENKPMDEEEAILQMELLNHDFFIFKNIDTDKTAVIYRRKDGNYGLIEEE